MSDEHGVPDQGLDARRAVRGRGARSSSSNIAQLPFIHKWIAAMPDVHLRQGRDGRQRDRRPTGAIIPAAVGVDIGCGMMAVRTTLDGDAICPTTCARCARRSSARCRTAAPTTAAATTAARGTTLPAAQRRGVGGSSRRATRPSSPSTRELGPRRRTCSHLGTLGTGNHFIEVCLDEDERVWVMLHCGSRGVGNRIGSYFIELAKQDMRRWFINLPDEDLAYLPEGTEHFDDYVRGGAAGRRTTRRRTAS